MKPACWEACFLYPCPTVEHSNNCLLLLCVLFLKPSGHYTNLINMSRTNAINGDIATFADNAPLNTFLRRRYEITNGTASGAPDAQDGYVEIHKTVSNDWIVIYAITNRGTVYTRAKTEGVWGAWTNCNDKLGVSIQRLEYRWDNQNPKLIVTDPNGYSAYVSLTKYQG